MWNMSVSKRERVLVQLAQHLVDVLVGRVQLAAGRLHAIILPGLLIHTHSQLAKTLLLPELPAIAHMGRGIKLREDSYSSDLGIADNLPDVLRCVHLARAVGTMQSKLGNSPRVEGEAVGVSDVPVEHVQLVVTHSPDDLLDDALGHEVPGGVKEQASVGKDRLVSDGGFSVDHQGV